MLPFFAYRVWGKKMLILSNNEIMVRDSAWTVFAKGKALKTLPRSGTIFFPQSLLELPEAQFGGNFQISPYGYIAAVDKGRKGGEISKLTESTSKWLPFQVPKVSTNLVQQLELRNSFFLKITSKSTISTLKNSKNNVFQRIVSFKIVGRWLMWLLAQLCPLFRQKMRFVGFVHKEMSTCIHGE